MAYIRFKTKYEAAATKGAAVKGVRARLASEWAIPTSAKTFVTDARDPKVEPKEVDGDHVLEQHEDLIFQ